MSRTDEAWWAQEGEPAQPEIFQGHARTSLHVAVRDGTRLAVDVYVPTGLANSQVTTVYSATPYFRSLRFRFAAAEKLFARATPGGAGPWPALARYGYASVVMEQRGCGASFGRRTVDAAGLIEDMVDVVDWIVAQPWSDGRVVPYGVSAPALAAQQLLSARHHAVIACLPLFASFDLYGALHPGGLTWGAAVGDVGDAMRALDHNRFADLAPNAVQRAVMRVLVRGLRPVDADPSERLLREALAERDDNEYIDVGGRAVDFRDDSFPGVSTGTTLDAQSPSALAAEIAAAAVPICAYAGWWDGTSALDMLQLNACAAGPGSRVVIGPWGHTGMFQEGARGAHARSRFDVVADMARFLGNEPSSPVVYFTFGAERWQSAPSWPPPAQRHRYHLDDGAALSMKAPGDDGADRLAVDPSAGSGTLARWAIVKHPREGVSYTNGAARDARMLTYTSAPLPAAIELTGHPTVSVWVSSSGDDAALFVYLEEVDAEGASWYVTEGMLRLLDRAVGANLGYDLLGDRVPRSMRRADAAPMPHGVAVEVPLDLLPISYRFAAGSRVRLAIAAGDADHFERLPGTPEIVISRGPANPSWVELPVVG